MIDRFLKNVYLVIIVSVSFVCLNLLYSTYTLNKKITQLEKDLLECENRLQSYKLANSEKNRIIFEEQRDNMLKQSKIDELMNQLKINSVKKTVIVNRRIDDYYVDNSTCDLKLKSIDSLLNETLNENN